jgi:hypothetical protein
LWGIRIFRNIGYPVMPMEGALRESMGRPFRRLVACSREPDASEHYGRYAPPVGGLVALPPLWFLAVDFWLMGLLFLAGLAAGLGELAEVVHEDVAGGEEVLGVVEVVVGADFAPFAGGEAFGVLVVDDDLAEHVAERFAGGSGGEFRSQESGSRQGGTRSGLAPQGEVHLSTGSRPAGEGERRGGFTTKPKALSLPKGHEGTKGNGWGRGRKTIR